MKKMNKFAVAIAALAALTAGRASAGIINPGYDLLETSNTTTFLGQNFQGVPVGTYDFGSGPVNTGNTDTIIHRLNQDPDTFNPGYFVVKLAVAVLALLVLLQAIVDALAPDQTGAR